MGNIFRFNTEKGAFVDILSNIDNFPDDNIVV